MPPAPITPQRSFFIAIVSFYDSKTQNFCDYFQAYTFFAGCAGRDMPCPAVPEHRRCCQTAGSFCPAPILRRMLSIFYVILCNDLRLIIFPQKGTQISKTRFSLCGHRRNAPADAGGLCPLRLRGLRNLPEISRSSRISQRWCRQQRTGRCWSWWERPCPRSS